MWAAIAPLDKPDGPPQMVLDGFTVAKDNYHNFANGLRFAPDGWRMLLDLLIKDGATIAPLCPPSS